MSGILSRTSFPRAADTLERRRPGWSRHPTRLALAAGADLIGHVRRHGEGTLPPSRGRGTGRADPRPDRPGRHHPHRLAGRGRPGSDRITRGQAATAELRGGWSTNGAVRHSGNRWHPRQTLNHWLRLSEMPGQTWVDESSHSHLADLRVRVAGLNDLPHPQQRPRRMRAVQPPPRQPHPRPHRSAALTSMADLTTPPTPPSGCAGRQSRAATPRRRDGTDRETLGVSLSMNVRWVLSGPGGRR